METELAEQVNICSVWATGRDNAHVINWRHLCHSVFGDASSGSMAECVISQSQGWQFDPINPSHMHKALNL